MLPRDASASALNFLFLFPDQWRWDWLGCAGYDIPVRTPNIDALAQRGLRFTQCRTNSPLCAPARAALAGGLRYHRTGVPRNGMELAPDTPTFFAALRSAGYRVAATGKTDLRRHGAPKHHDGWCRLLGQLGFTQAVNQSGKWDAVKTGWPQPQDPYMHHLHRAGLARTHVEDYQRRQALAGGAASSKGIIDTAPSPLPTEDTTDFFTARMAERYLNDWSVEDPWMLWVNFPGPHEPFDPPEPLQRRYDGVDFPGPVGSSDSKQDHLQLRRNYAAMIEGIDQCVGRLMAAVERRGELDRTVVVFASDHGEMLGDHDRWYKSVAFEGSVHVPLIVAGPGVATERRGQVSDALVELIDLGPTFLELAGLNGLTNCDARSLAPVLAGQVSDAAHRDVQVSQLGTWRMIFDGRHKLVEHDQGPTELYDLHRDPHELANLADQRPDVVESLSRRLGDEIGTSAVK